MKRLAWLALSACLATCGDPEPAMVGARDTVAGTSTELSVDSEAVEHGRGRKIWNFRCHFCHGYSGDARTLASTYLDPPPRDFTRADARELTAQQLRAAITDGRPGTAMKAFRGILSPDDIEAVAGFVQQEFIGARAVNTRYHTPENGWPDHERHRSAFAFARGDLALVRSSGKARHCTNAIARSATRPTAVQRVGSVAFSNRTRAT